MTIRFDDKVAIVTGAGGGLGKQHALEFARRGAKVVVNDLGGAVDGSGGASDAANAVVEEIKAEGGEAIANGSSVADKEGVSKMIAETMEKWGRIDILVNNAGILRDKSFHKITTEEFDQVMDVHFQGSFYASHAVYPIMREQNFGRIIFTTSSGGLCGNFGQANYGAAKMGMIGLMNCLKIEGQKYNVFSTRKFFCLRFICLLKNFNSLFWSAKKLPCIFHVRNRIPPSSNIFRRHLISSSKSKTHCF